MALPDAVQYGQVKWQVVSAVADNADADALPDAVPVTGSVTFTPSTSVLLATGGVPVTVIGTAVTYTLDTSGVLRDSQGRDLISLVATNSAGITPTGWTWDVSYRLNGGLSRGSFSFALPAGSVVDLTTVAPVGSSNGAQIIQGPQGVPGPPGGSDAGVINAVADHGLSTAGTGAANKTALNAAFAAGVTSGKVVYIPKGTYTVDPGVVWAGTAPKIAGASGYETVLRFTNVTADWLLIGNADTNSTNSGVGGHVRDLYLRSVSGTEAPTGFTAGFVANGVKHCTYERIWVDYAPVGIDMRNNNFGSSFRDCRALFSRNRVGLRLRGQGSGGVGYASGNDIPFYNCWIHGRDAAVWADDYGGGYHFYAGQLLCGSGTTAPNDLLGVVTIGARMEDETVFGPVVGITFSQVSFEGSHNRWAIRARCPGNTVDLYSCSFNGDASYEPGNEFIGIMKVGSGAQNFGYNDHVSFHDTRLSGKFANSPDQMVVMQASGTPAYPTFWESGTSGYTDHVTGGATSVPWHDRGLFDRANTIRANGTSGDRFMVGGLRLRNNAGVLEKSTNGTTWTAV